VRETLFMLISNYRVTNFQSFPFREDFLSRIREERCMHVGMVRARGQITGWLTEEIGLLETHDASTSEEGICMVVFHACDLYLFGRPARSRRESVLDMFPPGLRVCFDARAITKFRGVAYQAVVVLAGSWPSVPHPTMFPGGPGSISPCYK